MKLIRFDDVDVSLLQKSQVKLNKNQDQNQLNLLVESKTQYDYNNFTKLLEKIKSLLKRNKLETSQVPDDSKIVIIKPTSDELANVIQNSCDLAILINNHLSINQLFIEDPDTKLMTSNITFFEKILSNLVVKDKESMFLIKIDDISRTAQKVVSHLRHRSTIRRLQQIPTKYLITKNNQILDLETKEVETIDEFRLKYDCLSTSNVEIIDYSKQSIEDRTQSSVYRQIIERVMKDWSGNDKEKEYLLWQIMYSVLQNDNHGKFIVIKGPGGNGKSTYMTILSRLVGSKHVIHTNIHQFGDPNSINEINMSTRLIIGDDAATNHKISDVALSNLKSMITSNPISVNVKYEKNRIIQTNGVFIQGTNTDISFYENNPALQSRMIVFDWSTTDYRSIRSDLTFDLDDLIDKQDFINELFMLCLEKVDYFKEFNIPISVKESTNAMIESNDTIKQFLDDITEEINGFHTIPLKLLYHRFCLWFKEMNPSSGVMKFPTFLKLIQEKSASYHMTYHDKRKRFKNYDYLTSLSNILMIDDNSVFYQLQQYLTTKNFITQLELDNFEHSEHDNNRELSNREIQILKILIFDKHKSYLNAIYGHYL